MGWRETEALSDETDAEDGELWIARGEMEKALNGEKGVGRRSEEGGEIVLLFFCWADSSGQLVFYWER